MTTKPRMNYTLAEDLVYAATLACLGNADNRDVEKELAEAIAQGDFDGDQANFNGNPPSEISPEDLPALVVWAIDNAEGGRSKAADLILEYADSAIDSQEDYDLFNPDEAEG